MTKPEAKPERAPRNSKPLSASQAFARVRILRAEADERIKFAAAVERQKILGAELDIARRVVEDEKAGFLAMLATLPAKAAE